MKILVTDIAWPDLSIEQSVLGNIGAELILPPKADEPSLVQAAKGCSAILTCWAKTTRAVIEACDHCRIVARFGIGLDNIDVAYCTQRGIPVTNVPDYCMGEVADHTMALILACNRKVSFYDRSIKSGQYSLQAGYPLHRLAGQTLGIVGFGRIGKAVAKRATAFGLRVLAFSRSLSPQEASKHGVESADLERLLRESDYVSLHAPMTAETRHLISREKLSLMKSTAFLINTARGGLVDHAALLEALNSGKLRGAALDVTEPEPLPPNHPLVSHERVVHTPHAAFSSQESVAELRRRAAEEVVRVLRGDRPLNWVNPQVLG